MQNNYENTFLNRYLHISLFNEKSHISHLVIVNNCVFFFYKFIKYILVFLSITVVIRLYSSTIAKHKAYIYILVNCYWNPSEDISRSRFYISIWRLYLSVLSVRLNIHTFRHCRLRSKIIRHGIVVVRYNVVRSKH